MTSLSGKFIELGRTFHELAIAADATDDTALARLIGKERRLHWPDLLASHRIVLLSEAGSGKTEEVRQTAQRLRSEGKPAFFLRIESVSISFETAFEVGTYTEFLAWCESGDEGWLLLDSVDEARLRDPKDFELAIKIIGLKLAPVMQSAHIVITGRSSAWRMKTDPLLCRSVFPYQETQSVACESTAGSYEQLIATKEKWASQGPFTPFRIVALDDLTRAQIEKFLHGYGVTDTAAFLLAVEQKDVLQLMSRPQDLSELADFWKDYVRIGSRLELVQNSIKRRLIERDENRAEARPITLEKLTAGVRLIAAATTLTQNSAIQTPDGTGTPTGLIVREVLQDWDEKDCQSLLQRPIFEPGIYGAVRFHHRSIREYLTAEWVHHLFNAQAPRLRIEELFFRNQYGIEVVVPSLRPILPWLAILNPQILNRVIRLAPEIIFEGGDPSQLDCATRVKVLREVCEHLAQPARSYSPSDFASVQLFANVDLTNVIKELLAKHSDNPDICWVLLGMVWRGKIVGALPEAKALVRSGHDLHTRVAAFRALEVIGSEVDRASVRQEFLTEKGDQSREWLAELAADIPQDAGGIDWLLMALAKAQEKKRYEHDSLGRVVGQLINRLPLPLLPQMLDGLYELVHVPPLVEFIHYSVSSRNVWLIKSISLLISRLLSVQHPAVFSNSALSVLIMLPTLGAYIEDVKIDESVEDFSIAVPKWPELNYSLFWHAVGQARARCEAKGERLTNYWQAGAFDSYWRFDECRFDEILEDVRSRVELDDRLIAQSLAFSLYRQAGKPRVWRSRMKKIAQSDLELSAALDQLLHPPASEMGVLRRQDAKFKKQAIARRQSRERNEKKWKEWLTHNLDSVRNAFQPGVPSSAQQYLHSKISAGKTSSGMWSDGNWQSLIPEFGEIFATAYREGAMKFWRDYQPVMRSEGAPENTTPFAIILGLTGLAIEAREVESWADYLSHEEAIRATRYGLLELNGFASWMPTLFAVHPAAVLEVVNKEIDYEFEHDTPYGPDHYLLSTIAWAGSWLWNALAVGAIKRLARSPKSPSKLRHLLEILHGSDLPCEAIAKLAANKSKSIKNAELGPLWFASWVGVAPDVAIPTLSAHLANIAKPEDQTLFAMKFITALVGGRRKNKSAREAYRSVTHMKALYLLMHRYIRENEDIDRAGKGVYSPGLRDDAQDARNVLISFIKETPGKEAYLAMMEMSTVHPAEKSRPWMAYRAKEKATLDADIEPWSVEQILSFHRSLERTPRNHRELWYLAIERIRDYGHDLEHGNTSTADSLCYFGETAIRLFIANALNERAQSRYTISQESELADAKRPDILFHGAGFGSVPCELKLADRWTGPSLFERLEIQLCGDYLRDRQSNRGIFLLVYTGECKGWVHPNGAKIKGFPALIEALQNYWLVISPQFPEVEDIRVMGIDLTRRSIDTEARLGDKNARIRTNKARKANPRKPAV